MSARLESLLDAQRRADCAANDEPESAADRRRRKWVAAAIRARKDMGECDCDGVMVLELSALPDRFSPEVRK